MGAACKTSILTYNLILDMTKDKAENKKPPNMKMLNYLRALLKPSKSKCRNIR
jgi:hypothetical protein